MDEIGEISRDLELEHPIQETLIGSNSGKSKPQLSEILINGLPNQSQIHLQRRRRCSATPTPTPQHSDDLARSLADADLCPNAVISTIILSSTGVILFGPKIFLSSPIFYHKFILNS